MAGNGGFAFRPEQYNPEHLKRLDSRKVRAEYRKLQKRATGRLKTFEKHGLTRSKVYKYNKEMLTAISRMGEADVPYALADAYRFLTAKRGTVAGYLAVNQKIVDTLNEGGLTEINMENLEEFGDFMEYIREEGIKKGSFDSERLADLWATEAADKEIDIEEAFKKWKKQL